MDSALRVLAEKGYDDPAEVPSRAAVEEAVCALKIARDRADSRNEKVLRDACASALAMLETRDA